MEILTVFSSVLFIMIIISCLIYNLWKICKKSQSNNIVPTNWPVIGMFPALLLNAHNIHDRLTELLKHNGLMTFVFKGPVFTNLDMLVTCDPDNINYILSRNFGNYPKGPRFQKIFQVLGDGMINTDFEVWELHRRTTMPLMKHAQFSILLERNVSQKLENALFPILDRYARLGARFDLQEIFKRLTFDLSTQQFLDIDPDGLTCDHPFRKANKDAFNAIFYRHIFPESCWKLQKWVAGIDREKQLANAGKAFDQFIYPILLERLEQLNKNEQLLDSNSKFSMLTSHINAYQGKPTKFLRDTVLTLITAGGDTTASALTVLFWLLAKNPLVEAKVLDEILQLKQNLSKQDKIFKVEECHKLVYLHAACCESLRLFPPASFNPKAPMKTDILPSGHVVNPNTTILLSFYSMGRMEAVWGEDCMEFKPERWILPNGRIKHEPSYKFPVFNAGPRTCVGREMAFIVMKMVAATIICRYQFQLVEPHPPVQLADSTVLEMVHGLKVKFNKRETIN